MRELSLHILDLVQNSLEAGATEVSILVSENFANDKMIIAVADNGRGMSPVEVDIATDPFVTSRHTRKVGLGLPLLDMYTKLCDGFLNIESELGKGTKVEAVFKYSHIDRPPLGNIAETIKIIIIANPEVEFKYRHIVNDRVFHLSTQELINVLGGVPLCKPSVIEWLGEYLTNSLDFLYRSGGAEDENY